MEEIENTDRLSLLECIEHSEMVEYLPLLNGMITVKITPWSTVQAEELKPIVFEVFEKLREENKARKKSKKAKTEEQEEGQAEEKFFDVVMRILQREDFTEKAITLIYTTLKVSNKEIEVKLKNGKTKKQSFFAFKEVKNHLPISDVIKILRVIWEQNVGKNLSTELNQEEENQEENLENPGEIKTPKAQ